MSDKIEVGAQTSGRSEIEGLVSAIDRLEASLAKLGGNNNAMTRMAKQMAEMTKASKSGFDQLIELQATMEARSERMAEIAGARRVAQAEEKEARIARDSAAAAEKKLRQQVEFEQKQEASGNKFHYKQIEAADTAYARQLGDYVKFWEKIVAEQVKGENSQKAIQQRRDVETYTEAEKLRSAYVALWEKMLAERQAIQERRDAEMHAARQREFVDYVSLWDKLLAEQDAKQARQLEKERMQQYELAGIRAKAAAEQIAAADALAAKVASATEKQRSLNTNFLTSPLSGQISTAERAQVYGSMGGNAAEKYGSAAAAADIAALRAQHALLPAAVNGSTSAINSHNAAMNEAHALARGLAGSLGGLWLTYGSLVPLAAGAALAASLKGVVEQGRQVEYQLKFVEALGGGQVSLDKLLGITDQTVVSVREAAEGMRALAQNGLSASESLKVLPSLLNLSVIGEMSVSQAALAVTGAVSAFGLKLEDVDHVANVFAQAAATSNTSVIAMTESMKQGSTVASIYGASIEQAAGVMGVLAKNNIIGGAAGTAYTNMLSGLFAPTEKAKKALAELKVVTDDGNGHLKDQTVLLDEINRALNRYNDTARTTFMADIWTVRGTKSADAVLKNLDEYKKKVEEAKDVTNYMGQAVSVLEDSTTGAFKRLSNSVSSSLDKAFSSSSPALQALVTDMAHAAKDPGVVATLTNIADAALRLTRFIYDHIAAIAAMAGAYVGLRIAVAVLPAVITEASVAVFGFGVAMKSALGPLGWIAIAIGAMVTAYELFVNKTSDVEKADQKIQNSINNTIEYLDREIASLKERNRLRDDPGGAKTVAGGVTELEASLHGKRAEMARMDAQFSAARQLPNGLSARAPTQSEVDNLRASSPEYQKLQQQVLDGETKLNEVREKNHGLQIGRLTEEASKRRSSLLASLDDQVKMGLTHHKGAPGDLNPLFLGNQNEALYAKTQEAAKVKDLYMRGQLSESQAVAERNRIRDETSKMLDSRADKPDKKAANDALKADIEALQLKLDLAKMVSQEEANSLVQQNKRGELGDLQLINDQLKRKLELNHQAANTAKEQYDAIQASDKEPKQAALQKYTGLQAKANQQDISDKSAADEARLTALDKMAQAELQAEAKTLTDKGQLVAAFLKSYEAQYGLTIAKNNLDLADGDNSAYADGLRRYKAHLEDLKKAGTDDAAFKENKNTFDELLSQTQERISAAKAKAAEDGGLSGALGLADASNTIRSDLLPALQAAVNQMAIAAKESGVTSLITAADKAKTSLNNVTKDLSKSAQPFGDEWLKVWKTVEGAAHSAWMSIGTGGKNAFDQIGKVLKTAILDMLYQLTVKKWLVNIGASLGMTGTNGATSAVDAAGNIVKTGSALSDVSGLLSGASSAMTIAGSSTAAGFLSGLGAASGTGEAAMLASAATAGNLSIGASAGAALGGTGIGGAVSSGLTGASTMLAAIPVWGWAALGAVALTYAFGGSGPEDHTRLGFTSNNTAGNISINERGNEGKNSTYIDPGVSSSFGTFGVNSSFWMASDTPTVKNFLATVAQTDDALAQFLTTTEKASVSSYLTGKSYTAATGHEGSDPNAQGELDGVFRERLHNIMDGVELGLSSLTDNFSGTAQELATEASKILQFRQALIDGGVAVFGMKVSLQDVAALKQPTEKTSDALTRVTSVFNTTNQIASITGKTVEQMFGSIGLSSFKARDSLVQAAGGLTSLSQKVASYSTNFLTKSQQTAGASEQVTRTMSDLGLSSVTTKAAFEKVVRGLDLATPAGVSLFSSLMNVQQAFSDVYSASEGAATGLQDQIDQLTMTKIELLKKERDALDPVNRALFDNLQAQKTLADAKTGLSDAYDREVTSITATNDRLKTFSTSLRSFLDGLTLGSLSPLTPEEKYAAARGQFDSTLAKAQGGDQKAQDGLQAAANAYLEASRVTYSSSDAYTSDFRRVTAAVGGMANWADGQVDAGTASLEQLKLQVSALIDLKAAVQTLPEALATFMAAKTAAAGPFVTPAAPGINPGTVMPAPVSGFVQVTGAASMQEVVDELKKTQEELAAVKAAINTQTSVQAEATFAAADQAAQKQVEATYGAARAKTWNEENLVNAS